MVPSKAIIVNSPQIIVRKVSDVNYLLIIDRTVYIVVYNSDHDIVI